MTASSLILNGALPAPVCAEASAWDSQQAAAAAGGDVAAFRRLVERHGAALHRFCLHCLGCEKDAEDTCQEVFVRVWHALPRYKDTGQFRAWLWRIALNLCRDHLRARRVRRQWFCAWPADAAPEAISAAADSPDEAAALRADLARLAKGMDLLPEGLRLPLLLCCVENLPQNECAAILGMTVRAVETRIRRARQRLLAWWNGKA
jgi:RNA polymerase sigma-70 factor (ECF subfamily)